MIGVVTFRHVAANAATVVRLFGWRVLGACILAAALGRRRTFLEIAWSRS